MKKFIIIIPLIVIIIVIWFFNLRYINKIKTHKVEMKPSLHTSFFLPESLSQSDFKFKPLKRDPFNVTVDTGQKEPEMPQLSLRGIIIAKDGALALMELPDGNVYPMKKGEKYLGVKITKITSKEVTVDFRGKKETFTVWE